jgi:hypothetical protein
MKYLVFKEEMLNCDKFVTVLDDETGEMVPKTECSSLGSSPSLTSLTWHCSQETKEAKRGRQRSRGATTAGEE